MPLEKIANGFLLPHMLTPPTEFKASKLQAINNDKTKQLLAQGTVLCFDFGEKRIGVAMGEHILGLAHPLVTIQTESNDERFAAIALLISEWQPSVLVVGLPLSMQGEAHALTALSQKFARRLDGRFGIPVVMIDERLTSAEASQTLNEMGIRGRNQKPMLDQVAAQHILQSYFDQIAEQNRNMSRLNLPSDTKPALNTSNAQNDAKPYALPLPIPDTPIP